MTNDNQDRPAETGSPTTVLEYGLLYADLGYRVFPCLHGRKEPAIEKWPSRATHVAEQIERWFGDNPLLNIGLACGRQPNGQNIVVIDIDKKTGGIATWKALWAEHGVPQLTACHTTPNGGYHVFYDAGAVELTNSRNRIGPGIDTRATGGYVVLPPSMLVDADGVIIGRYEGMSKEGLALWN